jgi:hypothetical protein
MLKETIYCFKCLKFVEVTKIFYEDVEFSGPYIDGLYHGLRIGDVVTKCGHSRKERTGDDCSPVVGKVSEDNK